MKKASKLLLIVTLFLGILLPGCSPDAEAEEPRTATPGQIAPNFELLSLEGKTVSLRDYRSTPVLINFWATWCGPCVYEMPFLQQIYEERSDKGLVMLEINVGETPARVTSFMKQYNLSLPVLLDTNQAVARRYGITGLPTTFFINKDGVLQDKVIGAFPNKTEIEKRLEKFS